jgi:hypothetical protein
VARAQTRPRQVNISYSTLKVILNCIVSFWLINFKYLNTILVLSVAGCYGFIFITQNVNIKSVASKVCKMNLNKSEREIEVAEAANATYSSCRRNRRNVTRWHISVFITTIVSFNTYHMTLFFLFHPYHYRSQ